jgi:cellulose synthase/poly-beta-1,6-N-acetylglucosamine synthase-like glycosyltransferase
MGWMPTFEDRFILYVFILFSIFTIIQLCYLFIVFFRFVLHRKKNGLTNNTYPSVSVIIAARNESDNLFTNLPLILEQDYPSFEVIVVNHQSIDESYHILNAYKMQYEHLKVVEVENSRHLGVGKKLPLTLGIKSAKNNLLVFTDADCFPSSNNWLSYMVEGFSEGKEVVLGFSPYIEVEKSFLNKIIRFDTLFIAVNYFSFALIGKPYMGVGRNLAYTKKVFDSVKGFKSHYSISSGDDDLFVQEASNKRNVSIQINPDAFTMSQSKETWKEWIDQKTRHFSTSERYSFFTRILLGLYPFSLLIFWFLGVYLFFDSEYNYLAFLLFFSVILLKWTIQGLSFNKLKNRQFLPYLPFIELFYAILVPLIYYTRSTRNRNTWK